MIWDISAKLNEEVWELSAVIALDLIVPLKAWVFIL